MKKYLLSALVVFTFIAYSFHLRTEDGEVVKVVAPPGLPTTEPTPTRSEEEEDTPPVIAPTQTRSQVATPNNKYKDGQYTGVVADAFYGNIQVKATIKGGKISDIIFLQYPNDRRTSIDINTQAMPYLRSEAIQVQNAQVDIISGATDSSRAFRTSLESALAQAH
jgi:uncharacterized protein with FMN-binding domain